MNLTQIKGNTWVIEANQLIPLYKLGDGRCVLLDTGLFEEREELEETLRGAGLTSAGVLMQTGTIQNDGSQTGHPLMFYLSGKDIEQVRFSCKNQKIRFEDWTETRDEFGNAQNFTVPYGDDPSEYYYLLIDWIPEDTVEALHEPGTSIADLPPELREDQIILEIQFSNGKRDIKSISISLLDDGTFFAVFSDYEIKPEDDFVSRQDAPVIPRAILYGPG